MRYSAVHKEQSRDRILEAGRTLFRERGFDGASIDQVMNAAGLTRGAFYAHFDSKDDLVRQVLGIEAGLVKALRTAAATDVPKATGVAALENYLDPSQRINNATGCPLVAHPVDAIRGGADRTSGYTGHLRSLIESVQSVLGGEGSRNEAVLVSVLAVGGALLSAAADDGQLADLIEEVCADEIRAVVNP